MRYTNYTNMDSRFCRTYEQGDRLVKGWQGEVDTTTAGPQWALDHLFYVHNMDDRPDGQLCPSMSVGDVILFGNGEAWSVDNIGFVKVKVDPTDCITDRTWREVER